MWNLLSNAVKFTPAGGAVDISLRRCSGLVELRVSDTGQGIEPAFLPHLFERFRQADASMTRRHGGLGLGLAIVKELVELHGGTVQAESAGTGKGASFTVRLPLVEAPADQPEARRSLLTPPEPEALHGVKVLVVDDEPDALELMRRILAERGAEVTTAASAVEALAAIIRERPDVLVSDIGMPDVDGYELIRRVRGLDLQRGGAVPAVALTAYVRPEDAGQALAAGYQAHLPKPSDPSRLIATIARLVTGAEGVRARAHEAVENEVSPEHPG